MIRLEKIGRAFESPAGSVPALSDVTLEIDAGEMVWVNGPSGSGKSTLVNILGCLDRPTAGRYWFGGMDVSALDDENLAHLRREDIGLVFQNHCLVDSMTAQSNVELPAMYSGRPRTDRAASARQVLTSLGLETRLDQFPSELSGGECQRVAIGRALMNSPRVILADEPTGALDARQGREVLASLQQLAGQGLVVVVVSHDPAIATYATRRLELRDGMLVEDVETGSDSRTSEATPVGLPQAGRSRRSGFEGLLAAGRTLRASTRRAALLVAVAAVGVASAVALLGLANGAYQESFKVMGNLGADRIGIGSIPTEGGASGLDLDDAHAIERLPNVRETFPTQYVMSWARYGDRHVQDVEVYADDDRPEFMWDPWPLAQGEHIGHRDSEDRSQVVVIGPKLRQLLFSPDANPVGERIDVGGVPFEVKGVLAPHRIMEGETYRFRSFPPRLQIPLATARDLLLGLDVPLHVMVYVDDPARIDETAGEIRDLLFRRLGPSGYVISLDDQMVGPYRDSVKLQVRVLVGIGVASLAASAFASMLFMWTSVRQRRTEIAMRMAVGADRRDVLWQFLAESGATTLLGTALGVPLAFLVTAVVQFFADITPAYEPWFVWAAVAGGALAGLLSGVMPAYRASRLDPIAELAGN